MNNGHKRSLSIDPNKNTIVWGDNKDWLFHIPRKSVDCIYIDPPFFSQKNYEVIWGNGHEKRSFGDRWKGGIEHYIGWMRDRLLESYDTLKDTGSIFIHCDYRANYRLRMLLDEIFGYKNFINEIIWCYSGPSKKSKYFPRKHDTIIVYSKSREYKFHNLRTLHKRQNLSSGKTGMANKNKTKEEFRKAEILSLKKGKLIEDHWSDIPSGSHISKNERIGYKTQKPEKLIKRIIESTTNTNDVVLDFFGGGGTTASVCHKLNRRFITGDVSPVACRVIVERLKKAGCTDFEVKQIPKTKEEWHLTDGHKFAEMICEFMGWDCNPKKSGDGGIDGWANNKKVAVQIKNHKQSIGRRHIQGFVGSLNGYDEGIFVSWNFSPNAWDYVHIAQRDFKKKITLIPAHQILGELVLTMQQRIKYQKLYEKAIKQSKHAPPPLELVS